MTGPIDPPRDAPWRRLALFVVVAVAARALAFGSPVVHVDEPFYLTVAMGMVRGALPYVDLWDRKPVGLFLLYAPAAVCGLPAALYIYQVMATAAAVATAWLVARLAERAGWRAGSTAAGLVYILWLDLADGQGGQSPVFYNLPMALAAWLVLGRAGWRREVVAMLLVGAALQIKYSVVFEGMALGLWLLARAWRHQSVPQLAGRAVVLVAAALVPTALVAGFYAAAGHWDAFVFANFVSIAARGGDPGWLLAIHARDAAVILSPLLLIATPGRGTGAAPEREARRVVHGWLAVAVAGFVGFGGWYNHYTLPVMLPGSIALAGALSRRWLAAGLVALLAIAGQVILVAERHRRGTAGEFAALASRVGAGPGALFVYSGPVLLYPATGRAAPTRWLFPSHLEFDREAGSVGVDQTAEIDRIFANAPAAVVMGPPISEERPAIRALVLRHLAQGYRATPSLRLGSDSVVVWRRVTTPRAAPAAR